MKKYDVRDCRILRKKEIAPAIFDLTVEAGQMAEAARPGQFAQFFVPGRTLRRPISICGIDRRAGTLRFVFQVRGEGTALLARARPGQALNLLAPLGSGFRLGDTGRRALFLGGGVGLPPLLAAAESFGRNAVVAAGFRTRGSIVLREDFERLGCRVLIATDDGSFGHRGPVTDLAAGLEFDAVFACGPRPMLRAAAKLARARGVPCQVSMEERMACGIGACLGCAVRLRGKNGETYGMVCRDGPVFDASAVVWGD